MPRVLPGAGGFSSITKGPGGLPKRKFLNRSNWTASSQLSAQPCLASRRDCNRTLRVLSRGVFEVSTISDGKEGLEPAALSDPNQPTVSTASPAGSNVKSNSSNGKSLPDASRRSVSNRNRYRTRTAKCARRRLRVARKILHTTFSESRSKLLY